VLLKVSWVHGADFGSNTFQIDGADAASSVNTGPQYVNLSNRSNFRTSSSGRIG